MPRKLLRLAADSIFSFSLMPLRLALWLGFFAAAVALLGVIYGFAVRLVTNTWVPGWAACNSCSSALSANTSGASTAK